MSTVPPVTGGSATEIAQQEQGVQAETESPKLGEYTVTEVKSETQGLFRPFVEKRDKAEVSLQLVDGALVTETQLFVNYQTACGASNYEVTSERLKILFSDLNDQTEYAYKYSDDPQKKLNICIPLPKFSKFDDVYIAEKGRVILQNPKENIAIEQDGLNANNVGLSGVAKHIAAQYPNKSEQNIAHFWLMVKQRNIKTIVDLTRFKEDVGEHYYPELKSEPMPSSKGATKKKGKITISEPQLKETKVSKSYELVAHDQKSQILVSTDVSMPNQARHECLISFDGEEHLVTRVHIPNWPDFGATSVSEFNKLLLQLESASEQPMLIHCRGGIGRTMTTFAGLELLRQFKGGKITRENYQQVVFDTVLRLRYQRGPDSVQTEGQLKLLLDTTLDWIKEAEIKAAQ
ncbi:MAG: protein-tyrosine phosphatase family protein [Parashewanella sp.]